MIRLSIVIPTKNRYQTLFPVVDALIDNIIGNDYQIIISDNSDNNEVAVQYFMQKKYESIIKYNHTLSSLTQSENSDLALSLADGDFIVFIGDDDLVSPYILDAVDLMELKKIDCLIFSPANYYWDGVKFASNTRMRKAESMLVPKSIDRQLSELHSNITLNNVLMHGGVSIEKLPQQYHALVSKKTLNEVKKRFGSYVPGPCPDMSLAVGLSYVLDKYYSVNYPFTITGVSKHSAAGLGVRNQHIGKIEDQKFLPANILEYWNPLLPKVWTACTIWAQSIYTVMNKIGDKREIYYPEFYARMLIRESYAQEYIKPYIKKFISENPSLKGAFYKAVLKQRIKIFLIFLIDKILGGTPVLNYRLVKNIKTPNDCMLQLLLIPFKMKSEF